MKDYESSFEALDTAQQLQAATMFINARPGDGYLYYITGCDGRVLSRRRGSLQ